jgi:hypothetical protein
LASHDLERLLYVFFMTTQHASPIALFVAVAALIVSHPLGAQAPRRTVVVAAGEQYNAGPLHRMILGRHYRSLWTTPVEVEVLDLATYAGGLVPLSRGGGMQTLSLRLLGADGREYAFRSVDKDPSPVLDSLLRETFVDDLVQDGISAAHPYGALVAPPILEAAGVLHVVPELRLMPDDPSLGEFRAEFAGVLGTLEEYPDENEGARASFRGTAQVISSSGLVERLDAGPADRVDARAYLTARLVDVLLGDWDRHRDQWRWAVYDGRGAGRRWLPVPRDRDQAFSRFDGVATRIVSVYMPQFVRFEDDYPSLTRLHWNARDIDRWFLAELPRAVWDSTAAALQRSITDEVIDRSVGRLPSEILAMNGSELASMLRARRDALREASLDLYSVMARDVHVQATNAAERVVLEHVDAGRARVTITAEEVTYFDRLFDASETEEIRIYLREGDDVAVIQGAEASDITVRMVGGGGADSFVFEGAAEGVHLYDTGDATTVSGASPPRVNASPFAEWEWSQDDRDQPRDWGRRHLPVFWTQFETDIGLFLGGGVRTDAYGFRKRPWAWRLDARAGYAPALDKWRVVADARFNTESSAFYWTLSGRVSRLDIIHYYGEGNATSSAGRDYHRVDQTAARAAVGVGFATDARWTTSATLQLKRLSTRENSGRYWETLGSVYGEGRFVQLGLSASTTWDPLVESRTTGHRVRVSAEGSYFPDLLDVERGFGRAVLDVSGLLASSPWPAASLSVRARTEHVWGRFPWHEAAFLGGATSLRGWDEQRFAGDMALFGGAEARLRWMRPRIVVPVDSGLFGFAEAGRVFVDGDSPGGWHTTLGGGIWFHPVLQPYLGRLGVAVSEEATKLFATLTLPY